MAAPAQGQEGVQLNSLTPQQLKMLHNQLSEEVEVLSMSMQTLKTTQQRYLESKESLSELKEDNVGKDMLVPLNSSVYVPGQLADASTVVVDIGAGYYVEKSVKEAQEFFKRKMDFLKQQMEKVQPNIQSKFQTKQIVAQLLQNKMMAQANQTAPQKHRVHSYLSFEL